MTAVGIDTHKDSLAACVVDELGAPLAERMFANDPAAHEALWSWVQAAAPEATIGIEGSSRYGAAVARFLLTHGAPVREVPPQLTYRERGRTRLPGKSDPGDALAIARVTAREQALPPVRLSDRTVEIGLLTQAREDAVTEAVRVRNRLHADLVVLVPGYSAKVGNLVSLKNRRQAALMLRGRAGIQVELARSRLARLAALDREAKVLQARIGKLVGAHPLLEMPGVGLLTAAKLIAEAGDVRRFHSVDAFAMLAGVAPIPGELWPDPADAPQPRRQPPAESCAVHDRDGPGGPSPAGPRVPRPQGRGAQVRPRGDPSPEAPARAVSLPPSPCRCRGAQPGGLTR
jgi:transposase